MSGIVGDNVARASGVIASAGGGDFIKIATAEVTGSAVADVSLEGCFTSDYTLYQLRFERLIGDGADYFHPIMLDASNNALTGTYYSKGHYIAGEFNGSSPNGCTSMNSTTGVKLTNGYYSNRYIGTHGTMDFFDPQLTLGAAATANGPYPAFKTNIFGGMVSSNYYWHNDWIVYQGSTTPYGGIKFKMSAGNIEVGFRATMYGIKS